jgi:DNA-binding SARP family transcriptional activator
VTADGALRFAVLGPLLVEHGGEPLRLPQSELLRGLLGVLLAAEGEPLTSDRLVHLVRGRSAAGVQAGSVHVAVSRLRRWLRALPGAEAGRVGLEYGPSGYRLSAPTAAVDLTAFRDLVTRARRTPELQARLELLRTAMSLSRGPLLGDVPAVARGDPPLRAIEIDVREAGLALADTAIAVGGGDDRAGTALGWLEGQVRREPLDEPAHARLLTLLAASGLRTEAVARYEQVRSRLAEELGVSPSDEIQQAYLALLGQDRGVAAQAPALVRPAMLPADIATFTGRDGELRYVVDVCARTGRPGTAVRVVNIVGRPGVGKTVLATRAGHLLAGEYPDGQLYADLRDAEGRPVDAGDVLARFLRIHGRDGAAIPDQVDERAELYRDQLAGRRILVVLDNAAGETQVRPLLPDSPSCAVLVTSRRGLAGINARTMRLEVLDRSAALDLLRLTAGSERVTAEPDAADEILRLCGGLPLAIRIAGGRLARLPHRPLRWLADRLADDHRRLNELRLEDLEVRAGLRLTYQTLTRQAQVLLGRLSALEAPAVPAWVAAALLQTTRATAEDALDELVDAQFLDARLSDDAAQTCFHMHDLVRIFARERAAVDDDPIAPRAALLRRSPGTSWPGTPTCAATIGSPAPGGSPRRSSS